MVRVAALRGKAGETEIQPELLEWRLLHTDRAGEAAIWAAAHIMLNDHGAQAGDFALRGLKAAGARRDSEAVAQWLAILEIMAHLVKGSADPSRLN